MRKNNDILKLWDDATVPRLNHIKHYFNSRNITDIPDCFKWNKDEHSILAPVTFAGNEEVVGLKIISINTSSYTKIDTSIQGECDGGGIWFNGFDPKKLIVGVGLETVLLARQTMQIDSVDALTIEGMSKIKLPGSIEELYIMVNSDPNDTEQKAAKNLAKQFDGVCCLITSDDSCLKDTPNTIVFNELTEEQIRERFSKSDIYQKTNPDTIRDELRKLVDLRQLEQDSALKTLSNKYKANITALRHELKSIKKADTQSIDLFQEIDPFPDEVDGEELVIEIRKILERHVMLPDSTSLPIAIWCMLTYCFKTFSILPILGVISPEKRCGKTTLLEVIQAITNKPLMASNITKATVYRVIEKYSPTLLIDEADTFLGNNSELQGILNSGHRKKSAFVARTNPETLEPEFFSTFTPKVIAMIGKLKDTLQDRSIMITLRRKLPSENTIKIGLNFEDKHFEIKQKCVRWAADNGELLKTIEPTTPNVGNDRTVDNWTPLLTIAKTISNNCYDEILECMLKLTDKDDEQSTQIQLLSDIDSIFFDRDDRPISSEELVKKLNAMEESPWNEINKGRELTKHKLAKLLKGFRITPKSTRFGEKIKKGYSFKDFKEVFSRYLPAPPN